MDSKILFRAKAINRDPNREYRTNYKNGDWVYGLVSKLLECPGYTPIVEMTNTDGVSGIDVDINTIGQFIGLIDKNGKEIFKGDIVKVTYIEKRTFKNTEYSNEFTFTELVVFKNQAFQLEIDNCGIKMYRSIDFNYEHNGIKLKEIEVIGNIFDNFELLEGV